MKLSSSLFVVLSAFLAVKSIEAKDAKSVRGRRRVKDADLIKAARPTQRKLQYVEDANVMQTFFVPMPEEATFKYSFYQINYYRARPPIESLISVAISTDKTVVWWDHQEDGYDEDVTKKEKRSSMTEVWGDGDASNGCAPTVKSCTHANDVLYAGDTIVIQNSVDLPRQKNGHMVKRFDGGDRIQASFPIAVTRGAYPKQPGSLMAGAVEVLPTNDWGTHFEAPIGEDVGKHRDMNAFEYTAMFFMAGEDNTKVKITKSGKVYERTYNKGQGSAVRVSMGDTIDSSLPIQVDLLTGDVKSYYELRWYSLLSVEKYSSSYVSPVGDSFGKTKVLCYNSGPKTIKMRYEYYYVHGGKPKYKTKYFDLASKQYKMTDVIPTNSGAKIWSKNKENFIALSLTDTEFTVSSGQATGGQWYDWGFPVVPTNELTSQVLIGWGYGCTNNKCYNQKDRSVVWITPTADADIYVDYTNSGTPAKKYRVRRLQSIKITDAKDTDMSGAVIYAMKQGHNPKGDFTPVDIAAAWGQDPSVSYKYQSISLDLGTVVLPFTLAKVNKVADKQKVQAGEDLTYTIIVSNVGQKDIRGGEMIIQDKLGPHVSYDKQGVRFKCSMGNNGELPNKTDFPFDNAGYKIPFKIPRRGGKCKFEFTVNVHDNVEAGSIVNTGTLKHVGRLLPFEEKTEVIRVPKVGLENTVMLGNRGVSDCPNAKETVKGLENTDVTYCFKINNPGDTHLSDFYLVNKDLEFALKLPDVILAPNESKTINLDKRKIPAQNKGNEAFIQAIPVDSSGKAIPGMAPVYAKDPSSVQVIPLLPKVSIKNTVIHQPNAGAKCGTSAAKEKVVGLFDDEVTYCWYVKNEGNTYLSEVVVTNGFFKYSKKLSEPLPPGKGKLLVFGGRINRKLVNIAYVEAKPAHENGKCFSGQPRVSAKDDSGVDKISFDADIVIVNKVHLGTDGGETCKNKMNAIGDHVNDFYGSDVTFCFLVKNKGTSHLRNVQVTNPVLDFQDGSIGTLAPGEVKILYHEDKITGNIKNMALVKGLPFTEDGRRIKDLKEVTHEDPSGVSKKIHKPSIDVDVKVLLGTDKTKCGSEAAKDYVEDFPGEPATYCYMVQNTGTSILGNVKLSDKKLSFEKPIGKLALGEVKKVELPSTIIDSLTNVVVATGTPIVDMDSNERIPNQPDVTSSDSAEVGTLATDPAVSVENTVYSGHDDGESCNTPAAVEMVEGAPGIPVTYCFTVTNQGKTYLDGVSLYNVDLDFADTKTIPRLAPGESFTVHLPMYLVRTLENIVEVVAYPVTKRGRTVPHDEVTDADESAVSRVCAPSIDIDNKVAKGKDPAVCESDLPKNKVTGMPRSDVVYCFAVTNEGDTTLGKVVVTNEALDYEYEIDGLLEPNATIMLPYPGTIEEDLENIALVTGVPVYPNGTQIPGTREVTDCDPSEVEMRKFGEASIGVNNTVYAGNGDVSLCGTDAAKELVHGKFRSDATYCFDVVNTGLTHLKAFEIKNKEVPYFDKFDDLLPPGKSRMLRVPSSIMEEMENMVYVSAQPASEDGEPIVTMARVEASDPSGVGLIPHEPSVSIETTVYLGTEEDDLCGTDKAKEQVKEQYGQDVVYCLKVINDGKTHLENVVVVDENIKYEIDLNETLAPNDIVWLTVPRSLTKDLDNVANVTATPVLDDGTLIMPDSEVTDSDDSGVRLVPHEPKVTIINEVTEGDCATDDKFETIENFKYTNVSYCIEVKNTGDSDLCDLVVTNKMLDYTNNTLKHLSENATVMISVPGVLLDDLTNNVTVVGIPCLTDETPIPNTDPVSDDDDSIVKLKPYNHEVTIESTVYLGHDSGVKCGTNAAREWVEGIYDTPVTYCFVIENTGDNDLVDLTITNVDLDFTDTSISHLAPGEQAKIYVEEQIETGLVNWAVVEGMPADIKEEVIAGAAPVTDKDDSSVDLIPQTPAISVTNFVYQETYGPPSEKCPDADMNTTSGIYNTGVVYCFLVTNLGDTYLDSINVTNDDLGFKTTIDPLEPGESIPVHLYVTGKITTDLNNTVTVVGNPVTEEGLDIPAEGNVEGAASSGVELLELPADIEIVNGNFLGEGGPAECVNATDMSTGMYSDDVTFCFTVKNKGKTALCTIKIQDEQLNIKDLPVRDLMAGDETTVTVPGVITASESNTAHVTGYPCLEDLTTLLPTDTVSAEDDSGVDLIPFEPSITIDNEVYLGDDDGESCNTDAAGESQEGYNGTPVTYCFTVTNSGNVPLDNVKINNVALDFVDDESVGKLAPDESIQITVAYATTIDGTLKNSAVVTADAVLPNGDSKEVSDEDPSGVIEISYHPSINITNVVYIGDDAGENCDTGLEVVEGLEDTPVVYCFNVTNLGDTYLSKVVVTNGVFGLHDNTIGTLPPNGYKLVPYKSTITADLENIAQVTAFPSMDATGTLIAGAGQVTSSDPSEVLLKIQGDPKNGDKDPYSPPTDDDDCLEEVWKVTEPSDLVCATGSVFVENVKAEEDASCTEGEEIEVTIDGTIRIQNGGHSDVGWYVAVDGGDALTGKCVVNGLQQGNQYLVADADGTSAGLVSWNDGDSCGDVSLNDDVDAASIDIPIVVKTKLTCSDAEPYDDQLDFAICFTWNDSQDHSCTFSKNIPSASTGSCYCTRVTVPNVEVIKVLDDPVGPC